MLPDRAKSLVMARLKRRAHRGLILTRLNLSPRLRFARSGLPFIMDTNRISPGSLSLVLDTG
jgi:hypothetical protein